MRLIIIYVFVITSISFAEHPDTTIAKLKERESLIKSASKMFDVDSRILSAIIYVERSVNFNWEDEAMDNLLAKGGLNSSIGFCQVKMKTAYWIEVHLNDSSSSYCAGKKYSGLLMLSESPEEIISKLENDSLNIMYAAAYLRIIISQWEKTGYPIDNRADILGTLYSTGLFNRNGKERLPNKNPKANKFGEKVQRSFVMINKR